MSRRRSVLVEVKPRPGEAQERMIRRFFKKCKKQDIVKEYLEKTSFARSKSQKRRDKIRKNKRLRELERLKLLRKYAKSKRKR